MAGYSGTPLRKKLGFADGVRVAVVDAPADYASWFDGDAPDVVKLSGNGTIDAGHIFVREANALAKLLPQMRKRLRADGFFWVSWPKKSSKVATDVTEDTIREIALPLGLVDVKVCAVSDVWSGLKLVIRKSERSPMRPAERRA